LLSNASKYSPMGARIDLVVEVNPSDIYFAIRDRGEGIPEEGRGAVFKRFERLETGSETDYGTGLGLSVVKAIVEGHGGAVGIEPRDGGGTAFWFTLPLSESAA
jgi:K+-sensing histidine kinase KdpD